jgi:hypothetical protein
MQCFVLLVLFTVGSCDAKAQSAKEKREAAYQAKLQSYSDVLKPGTTRENVEDYLRAKGVAFGQLCCIDERSASADLVKIGKEKRPWYCEENNAYVAFQFAAVEPHKGWEAYDSDTLKSITIYHKFEGCL